MKTSFDDAGLKRIRQVRQRVTLVRDIDASVGPSTSAALAEACSSSDDDVDVAWQAFEPHEDDQIVWNDVFFAYMSTTIPRIGGAIFMNATLQVSVGSRCIYKDGDIALVPGIGGGSIVIVNQGDEPTVAFGIAQRADINDTPQLRPLCVVPVLRNQSACFTPREGVRVFASSCKQGGSVIPPVGALPTFKREDRLIFDDSNDAFSVATR